METWKSDHDCSLGIRFNLFGEFPVVMALIACLVVSAGSAKAAKLKPETVRAFETYVQAVEVGLDSALKGEQKLLWAEKSPGLYQRALKGETVVEKAVAIKDFEVPDGRIHDWRGTIFLQCDLDRVLAVLRDVERHKEIYPEVVDSRLISQSGEVWRSYLRFKKTKVITVVLNTEHEVRYMAAADGPGRHVRSRSTRIAEVADADMPEEREKPVGDDHGLLWRLYGYWQLLPVSGGTLVECRAVTLTRDVPFALSWMVGPFVTSVPRESLSQTLEHTRRAALGKPPLVSPAE